VFDQIVSVYLKTINIGTIYESDCMKKTQSITDEIDPSEVEGIDFIQFLNLMIALKYVVEPNELLAQAWKNISHTNQVGVKKGEIVSLRNLIIFLIAIENIFIKSMGLQEDIPFDGKNLE
jgi:hypothetical protein